MDTNREGAFIGSWMRSERVAIFSSPLRPRLLPKQ
jgi:hypothetical protein